MALSQRRPRRLVRAASIVFVAGLVGCTPVANTSQQQDDDSILREMVANDRQQIEELQQRVARLNDRLAEMEHNGAAAGEKGVAALEARVTKLETQLASAQPTASAAVPGGTGSAPPAEAAPPGAAIPPAEVASTGMAATSPAVGTAAPAGATGGTETASAVPPAPVSPPPMPGPAPKPAASTPPAPAVPPAPSWRTMLDQELTASHSDAGAKLYQAGLADLKAGQYAQGVAKMQDLQRKYPKSDLSEPAEFFAGNGLYEQGKYDQAILQFNDLSMRFPNGRFATASLLREADAFVKINDPIDARLTLQKLITEHPDAPEAPMAKSMMETLANG